MRILTATLVLGIVFCDLLATSPCDAQSAPTGSAILYSPADYTEVLDAMVRQSRRAPDRKIGSRIAYNKARQQFTEEQFDASKQRIATLVLRGTLRLRTAREIRLSVPGRADITNPQQIQTALDRLYAASGGSSWFTTAVQ